MKRFFLPSLIAAAFCVAPDVTGAAWDPRKCSELQLQAIVTCLQAAELPVMQNPSFKMLEDDLQVAAQEGSLPARVVRQICLTASRTRTIALDQPDEKDAIDVCRERACALFACKLPAAHARPGDCKGRFMQIKQRIEEATKQELTRTERVDFQEQDLKKFADVWIDEDKSGKAFGALLCRLYRVTEFKLSKGLDTALDDLRPMSDRRVAAQFVLDCQKIFGEAGLAELLDKGLIKDKIKLLMDLKKDTYQLPAAASVSLDALPTDHGAAAIAAAIADSCAVPAYPFDLPCDDADGAEAASSPLPEAQYNAICERPEAAQAAEQVPALVPTDIVAGAAQVAADDPGALRSAESQQILEGAAGAGTVPAAYTSQSKKKQRQRAKNKTGQGEQAPQKEALEAGEVEISRSPDAFEYEQSPAYFSDADNANLLDDGCHENADAKDLENAEATPVLAGTSVSQIATIDIQELAGQPEKNISENEKHGSEHPPLRAVSLQEAIRGYIPPMPQSALTLEEVERGMHAPVVPFVQMQVAPNAHSVGASLAVHFPADPMAQPGFFHDVVKRGDYDALGLALCLARSGSFDLGARCLQPAWRHPQDGTTALEVAYRNGDTRMVVWLIRYGFNARERGPNGLTCLDIAGIDGARSHRFSDAQVSIDADQGGAEGDDDISGIVRSVPKDEQPYAFHKAVVQGDDRFVEAAMQWSLVGQYNAGVYYDRDTRRATHYWRHPVSGTTAYEEACFEGDLPMICLLGAQGFKDDGKGIWPSYRDILASLHPQLLLEVPEEGSPKVRSPFATTILQSQLCEAARRGEPYATANILIQHPELQRDWKHPKTGETALHLAVREGFLVATLLTAAGWDADLKSDAGKSAVDLGHELHPQGVFALWSKS